jgi:hypothetical protein
MGRKLPYSARSREKEEELPLEAMGSWTVTRKTPSGKAASIWSSWRREGTD